MWVKEVFMKNKKNIFKPSPFERRLVNQEKAILMKLIRMALRDEPSFWRALEILKFDETSEKLRVCYGSVCISASKPSYDFVLSSNSVKWFIRSPLLKTRDFKDKLGEKDADDVVKFFYHLRKTYPVVFENWILKNPWVSNY
jgi:hypothetical protein